VGQCNHLFQTLSKSVKGFPSCEGPNMGVGFALTDSRPYNRSALPCCLWYSASP